MSPVSIAAMPFSGCQRFQAQSKGPNNAGLFEFGDRLLPLALAGPGILPDMELEEVDRACERGPDLLGIVEDVRARGKTVWRASLGEDGHFQFAGGILEASTRARPGYSAATPPIKPSLRPLP